MSTDINEQVLTEVHIVIQLNETTDVSNYAQLLVFVRHAIKDSSRSELVLSNELRTSTRRADVFELVDNFFKKNGF